MKWYFFASSVLSNLLSSFNEWIFAAVLLKNNKKKQKITRWLLIHSDKRVLQLR